MKYEILHPVDFHGNLNAIAEVLGGEDKLLKYNKDFMLVVGHPSLLDFEDELIAPFLSPALISSGLPDLTSKRKIDGNYQYPYVGWQGHEVSIAVYDDLICYTNTGAYSGENPGTYIIPINNVTRKSLDTFLNSHHMGLGRNYTTIKLFFQNLVKCIAHTYGKEKTMYITAHLYKPRDMKQTGLLDANLPIFYMRQQHQVADNCNISSRKKLHLSTCLLTMMKEQGETLTLSGINEDDIQMNAQIMVSNIAKFFFEHRKEILDKYKQFSSRTRDIAVDRIIEHITNFPTSSTEHEPVRGHLAWICAQYYYDRTIGRGAQSENPQKQHQDQLRVERIEHAIHSVETSNPNLFAQYHNLCTLLKLLAYGSINQTETSNTSPENTHQIDDLKHGLVNIIKAFLEGGKERDIFGEVISNKFNFFTILIQSFNLLENADETIIRLLESGLQLSREVDGRKLKVFFETADPNTILALLNNNKNNILLDRSTLLILLDRVGKEHLAGVNLRGADLRNLDLSGANLKGANLSQTKLNSAILTNANLSEANFNNADLIGVDASGATFTNANLENASLRNAVFRDAVLIAANLERADFSKADCTGADLTKTILTRAMIIDAIFTGADLTEATLIKTMIISSNLTHAILNSSDLTRANFMTVNLSSVTLDQDTQFSETQFDDQVDLTNVDFTQVLEKRGVDYVIAYHTLKDLSMTLDGPTFLHLYHSKNPKYYASILILNDVLSKEKIATVDEDKIKIIENLDKTLQEIMRAEEQTEKIQEDSASLISEIQTKTEQLLIHAARIFIRPHPSASSTRSPQFYVAPINPNAFNAYEERLNKALELAGIHPEDLQKGASDTAIDQTHSLEMVS